MVKPWILLKSETVTENRIFSLITHTAESPESGRRNDFHVLEAGDWVNVIPVTRDGEVVLVRQYRHGTREITLEIPGGMVEAGQTAEEAAARELAEETGYRAEKLTYLGRVRPNPAILNNWCYSYLAENAYLAGAPEPDENEELDVVTMSLDGVLNAIDEGEIDHALVLNAFYFFHAVRRKNCVGEAGENTD